MKQKKHWKKAQENKAWNKELELSKQRTLLSLERTIMGKEKVVLSEITVMVAFMALGFALIKFFESTNKVLVGLGVVFSVIAALGVLYLILSFRKYAGELRKVEKKQEFEE